MNVGAVNEHSAILIPSFFNFSGSSVDALVCNPKRGAKFGTTLQLGLATTERKE